uniref:Zinc metalloproteinase n=1 Tax=Strongyloides venezuelensis TaxID=75913 RepID=A0A0K0F4I9_STRVS
MKIHVILLIIILSVFLHYVTADNYLKKIYKKIFEKKKEISEKNKMTKSNNESTTTKHPITTVKIGTIANKIKKEEQKKTKLKNTLTSTIATTKPTTEKPTNKSVIDNNKTVTKDIGTKANLINKNKFNETRTTKKVITKKGINETFSDNKMNAIGENIKNTVIIGKNIYKWTFPILYTVAKPVNETFVDQGIKFLMKQTCVKFKKVKNVMKTNGIRYVKREGCWSYIGRSKFNKFQDISIGTECQENWIMHHETMHALGVIHEMSRPDRDNYLKIVKKNVNPQEYHNFLKVTSYNTYNIRFDFGSVMQYYMYAFSKDKKITIIPNNHHYLKTLGQSVHASFNDLKLVNKFYCNNVCKKKLNCLNNGYTNTKNCKVCMCPRFYRGKLCEKLRKSQKQCPKQIHIARSTFKTLYVRGIKKCYFKLTTQKNFKIKMVLVDSNLPHAEFCSPHIGLEIKFLLDKGVSGVLFCAKDKNKTITSKGNEVTMYYEGLKKHQFFKIRYIKVKV